MSKQDGTSTENKCARSNTPDNGCQNNECAGVLLVLYQGVKKPAPYKIIVACLLEVAVERLNNLEGCPVVENLKKKLAEIAETFARSEDEFNQQINQVDIQSLKPLLDELESLVPDEFKKLVV